MIHVDTSFVVDLSRETRAGSPGPAHRALEDLSEETFGVSVHVAAELYAGAHAYHQPDAEVAKLERLLALLTPVLPDERFAPEYGRLAAYLRRSGQTVSSMDLLIGTAALLDEAPLITRDAGGFSRIPGLRVLGY